MQSSLRLWPWSGCGKAATVLLGKDLAQFSFLWKYIVFFVLIKSARHREALLAPYLEKTNLHMITDSVAFEILFVYISVT